MSMHFHFIERKGNEMRANIQSYKTWNMYDDTIEVTVDKEMLDLINNQLRIELARCIENDDFEYAKALLNDKLIIDDKIAWREMEREKKMTERNGNAERETEE